MEILYRLLIIFFIGSMLGYLIEVFFRRFVSQKRWVNPGFMVGPWLPIYGFGLILLYYICNIEFPFDNSYLSLFLKMLIICFAMTLIELIGGEVFIKGMNIKLWDYSNEWGNYKGIICPLFSFYWTIIGLIYYLTCHKFIDGISSFLLNQSFMPFIIGLVLGIFLIDFATSYGLANKMRKFAKEKHLVVNYEILKYDLSYLPRKIRDNFNELEEKYRSSIQDFENENPELQRFEKFAFSGFILSLFGFNIVSLIISITGLRSEKNHKFALIGTILSLLEIIALIIVLALLHLNII